MRGRRARRAAGARRDRRCRCAGKPLRDKIVLRLIAVNRALHFVGLGAAGRRDPAVQRQPRRPARRRPARRRRRHRRVRQRRGHAAATGSPHRIDELFTLRSGRLHLFAAIALVYAMVEGIEAVGPVVRSAGPNTSRCRHRVAAAARGLRAEPPRDAHRHRLRRRLLQVAAAPSGPRRATGAQLVRDAVRRLPPPPFDGLPTSPGQRRARAALRGAADFRARRARRVRLLIKHPIDDLVSDSSALPASPTPTCCATPRRGCRQRVGAGARGRRAAHRGLRPSRLSPGAPRTRSSPSPMPGATPGAQRREVVGSPTPTPSPRGQPSALAEAIRRCFRPGRSGAAPSLMP